jgi:ribosomal protein S18 acetylase RimI-like enzyme
MNIVTANTNDIKAIYDLYDMATAYQQTVFDKQWEGFEPTLIQQEINEKRLWKITRDEQIVCVFSLNFNDELFWKEKDKEPSIYIHRIALDNAFRGQSIMKTIIEWAKLYCRNHNKQFIRMDTWGENNRLIDYYKKCGFTHTETIDLDNTAGLPSHYKGKLALLEMSVSSS